MGEDELHGHVKYAARKLGRIERMLDRPDLTRRQRVVMEQVIMETTNDLRAVVFNIRRQRA